MTANKRQLASPRASQATPTKPPSTRLPAAENSAIVSAELSLLCSQTSDGLERASNDFGWSIDDDLSRVDLILNDLERVSAMLRLHAKRLRHNYGK